MPIDYRLAGNEARHPGTWVCPLCGSRVTSSVNAPLCPEHQVRMQDVSSDDTADAG
jgi:hypothetical protein